MIKLFTICLLLSFGFLSGTAACQDRNEYEARIGNLREYEVAKTKLIAQKGILAQMRINDHHWEAIEVVEYSVMIIRMDTCLATYKNNGREFEDSLKALLQKSTKNDRILFFSICCKLADGKTLFVQPLECKLH